MKRLATLLLAFALCVGSAGWAQTARLPKQAKTQVDKSPRVYVDTGKRIYHTRQTCPGVTAASAVTMTRKQAKQQDYKLCKLCRK
jgi:hypothetical protein